MVATTDIGTPGEGNKKIGGVPTLHYLDFLSRGRGQVVRLFWEDAGIAYKDVRYNNDELPQAQDGKLGALNPLKSVPIVELNGKILTQSYPMLRHFSRLLGAYDGTTEDERYWVDVMCDIGIDWRTLFVQAFTSSNKNDYTEYGRTCRIRFLQALEQQLQSNALSQKGPYVLSNRITYADFVIYQVAHDDGLSKDGRAGLKEYPRIAQLVEAFEARPAIKQFMASDRYLG